MRKLLFAFLARLAVAILNSCAPSTRNALSALGHDMGVDERGLGNAHGLIIGYTSAGRPVQFDGGTDPRGEGALRQEDVPESGWGVRYVCFSGE